MVDALQNLAIRHHRPQAERITPLISGEMNDMILVDETEIFRFPRTLESKKRLVYESRVLEALEGKLVTPIPRLIYLDEKKEFSVLSYIKGEVLHAADIQGFSDNKRYDLAHTLAVFMRELNAHLSVTQLQLWTGELMPSNDSWDQYYASIVRSEHENIYSDQYRRQYKKVTKLQAAAERVPIIAIHGDLHAGNMLFTGTKLSGVIDFGDCETGTIYNELRPLYSLGLDMVQRTVSELDGALGEVDVHLVREMAIMHELSVLARSDSETLKTSSRVSIARALLTTWLGNDWEQAKDTQVKAIIFDCFGVLTSERWIPFRQKHFHTGEAKAFAQKMMGKLVTGRIQPQEFISTIAQKGDVGEDQVLDSLTGSSADEKLFGWIYRNKHIYKIGMLSNVGSDRLDTLFTKDHIEVFDDIVLSFHVGMAKPDPRIYELAAERLGVRPSECLFVDDKEVFCQAARDVGMKAVKYKTFRDFEEYVEQ